MPASGWAGVWVLGMPAVWSWGLEEGVQRCVLVTEEGPVSEAGGGGSDNVSRMDAHRAVSGQSLIQVLAVKDLILAKSS